jgi:hypothetical protein
MTEFKGLERQVLDRDEALPKTAQFAEQRIKPLLNCAGGSHDLLCRDPSLFALGLGGYPLFRIGDLGCNCCACSPDETPSALPRHLNIESEMP